MGEDVLVACVAAEFDLGVAGSLVSGKLGGAPCNGDEVATFPAAYVRMIGIPGREDVLQLAHRI